MSKTNFVSVSLPEGTNITGQDLVFLRSLLASSESVTFKAQVDEDFNVTSIDIKPQLNGPFQLEKPILKPV